ncbi:unnamed protein product [Gordionus sp. m RMFG-2023]
MNCFLNQSYIELSSVSKQDFFTIIEQNYHLKLAKDSKLHDVLHIAFLGHGIFGMIFILSGIIGNILTLIVLSDIKPDIPIYFFVRWLSLVDIETCIMFLNYPNMYYLAKYFDWRFRFNYYYNYILSKFVVVLGLMGMKSGGMLIACLSFDRYIAICHPLKYKKWTQVPLPKKVAMPLVILVICAIGAFMQLFRFYISEVKPDFPYEIFLKMSSYYDICQDVLLNTYLVNKKFKNASDAFCDFNATYISFCKIVILTKDDIYEKYSLPLNKSTIYLNNEHHTIYYETLENYMMLTNFYYRIALWIREFITVYSPIFLMIFFSTSTLINFKRVISKKKILGQYGKNIGIISVVKSNLNISIDNTANNIIHKKTAKIHTITYKKEDQLLMFAILILVVAYLIGVLPLSLYFILTKNNNGYVNRNTFTFVIAAQELALAHSAMNFISHMCTNKSFRNHFKRKFHRFICYNNNKSYNNHVEISKSV